MKKADIEHQLIDLEKAIAIIPSLAIHMDREANEEHAIDKQKHLPPVLMKLPENEVESKVDFKEMLLKILNANDGSKWYRAG